MTESLADDEAAYAYVRMKLGNDEYSERVKFAFVVWQGEWMGLSHSFVLRIVRNGRRSESHTHRIRVKRKLILKSSY
jgi:hypothetical protein